MIAALTLLLPMAAAMLIAVAGMLPDRARHRLRRGTAILAPLAVLPAVALSLTEPGSPGAGLDVTWLVLGSSFMLDELARPLVLIAALLYGAALMNVSWLKLRDAERGSGTLSAFLLVCFTGNVGTYLAADVVSFYLSFTLMSFAAAGLVVHYRTRAARRATRIYLVMSVLAETAILAGLLMLASQMATLSLQHAPDAVAGSPHRGVIIGLLLAGFAVKAGTMPLHVWLPLAHPAAPPAASAVLSGAMVKTGLVGWLRFLPDGEAAASEPAAALTVAGWALLVSALAGAFLAVALGILQNDPKVVLAYSTISQMGFMAAVVAVGLIEPQYAEVTAAAAVIYAVHHGLAKGALFLGVPVAKHYGHGATGVLVAIGLGGAALAVAGAPLTSGAFSKYVSKEAVEAVSVLGIGLDAVLPFVATGSTALLLRFGWIMWRAEREPRRGLDGELISWLLVVAAGIAVPWWIGVHWMPLGTPDADAAVIWDATWPILLGLGLGALAVLLVRRSALPDGVAKADGTVVQPGDLVVAEERALRWAGSRTVGGLDVAHRVAATAAEVPARWIARVAEAGRRAASALDGRLASWEASGLILILVLTVALAAGVLGRWPT